MHKLICDFFCTLKKDSKQLKGNAMVVEVSVMFIFIAGKV